LTAKVVAVEVLEGLEDVLALTIQGAQQRLVLV
jgi:hypothetical protein